MRVSRSAAVRRAGRIHRAEPCGLVWQGPSPKPQRGPKTKAASPRWARTKACPASSAPDRATRRTSPLDEPPRHADGPL